MAYNRHDALKVRGKLSRLRKISNTTAIMDRKIPG
jgi:hypothetical protein